MFTINLEDGREAPSKASNLFSYQKPENVYDNKLRDKTARIIDNLTKQERMKNRQQKQNRKLFIKIFCIF